MMRRLEHDGYSNLIVRNKEDLDLREAPLVERFFAEEQPEYVFLCAARVGGIYANSHYPAEFIYDNLAIQSNVIHAAHRHGVKKLLFLGSSCIYPKFAPQPMREEYLLTGDLEPTNQWYAVAKIAGLKMIDAYRRQYGFPGICAMLTNLYGPRDNFDRDRAHVLPALLRRFDEAASRGDEEVLVWGSGEPRREFLFVDDLAHALVFLMQHYDSDEIINVGAGQDVSIAELAYLVAQVTGFEGRIVFDPSRPDGTPRKLLDVSKLHALGWRARTSLHDGLKQTFAWYAEHRHALPRG